MNNSRNSEPETTGSPNQKGLPKAWWPRLKTFGKGVTGLAGLGAAIVAILAWFPLARDFVDPNFKEYENLKALYAGASVSLFDGKLGPPAIVKAVPGETGIMERLYVKKDYLVETLASADGQTKLYSVLSCSPDFKPSFNFQGTKITLQDKPLAAQMPFGRPPEHLYYEPPATVSSPTFYFEITAETGGASHNRGSGYGVNSVDGTCGDLPVQGYEGPPDKAPQEVSDYRAKTVPNFYVETWDRTIRDQTVDVGNPYLLVTPFHEDVPPGWHRPQ
jgi:hypothetical protein